MYKNITTHALNGTMTFNSCKKFLSHALKSTLLDYYQNRREIIGRLVVIGFNTNSLKAYALEHQDAHFVALRLLSKIVFIFEAVYVIYTDQEQTLSQS